METGCKYRDKRQSTVYVCVVSLKDYVVCRMNDRSAAAVAVTIASTSICTAIITMLSMLCVGYK